MISIVVPTYREADNLEPLARAVNAAMTSAGIEYELLIVDDDSGDGIEERAEALSAELPVRCYRRIGAVRDLSWSVLDGISLAAFDLVVVMDADLSHPADAIPAMVELLRSGQADLVVGSRYVDGGSFDRSWDLWRYFNSFVATRLARPLTTCTDPMSGFFALHRSSLPPRSELRPIGYKILLELLVRGDFSKVVDVPIQFRDRATGESKMNLQQQWNFLRHLRRLYLNRYRKPAELVHFLAVGASGFVIDVSVYYVLQVTGVSHLAARAISFWPAVTSNWFLNRQTTFSERGARPKLRQWAEFAFACMVGFTINWGTYALLTSFLPFFDHFRLVALLLGVGAGTAFNFTIASFVVYSEQRGDSVARGEGGTTAPP